MYKHLTSIKKRQEETTAHTQNRTPEKDEQKRAAERPENTNPEDRRGETRVEKKGENDSTVSLVKFRKRVVVMQDRPAPPTSAEPEPGREKVEGGGDQ